MVMKKSRFTEEQISFALKRAQSGESVADICRELGVSQKDVDPLF
jgi:putative transposase